MFLEHPCRSVISIKLQSNLIEITFWHGCSPVNCPSKNTESNDKRKAKSKIKYKECNNSHNNDVNLKSVKAYHLHLLLLNRAAVLRVL